MTLTIQEEIRGALARGYCTDDNADKQLDAVLVEAQAKEIEKLICPAGMVAKDFFDPLTLIDYGGGQFGPLLFHWATEDEDAARIAAEHCYKHYWVRMCDVLDDDHPAMRAYDDGRDGALAMWEPPAAKEGFVLVAKVDTDDGPVAHYLCAPVEVGDGSEDHEHA